ncbi:MAG: Dinitrogenase iron-molybdenum cofactor [bacterium ADurb.Bin478]|nr:MAG: Dinitrogenase iron-molybdenum cofactor [bacterium ADurb.Bin478]
MRIAVSATGGSLSAKVDPRFGRCAYFVMVDSKTMKISAFSNPAFQAAGGAGPAAANEVARNKVEVLLTGQVGGNAQQALEAAGIEIVTGVGGTVREAIEAFLTERKL